MKATHPLLVSLMCICVFVPSMGQVVDIPDPIFKYKLINHDPVIDLNQDGEIQNTEAVSFTGTMDISYNASDPGYITDLIGLEAFIHLDQFIASNQQIAVIDLTANTELRLINASGNPYEQLSFTNHPLLEVIQSNFGNLSNLDISGAVALVFLNAQGNQLQSIDLSNNPSLQGIQLSNNPITAYDFSKNPMLRYLYCRNNDLTHLDVSQNAMLFTLDCQDNGDLGYINLKNGNNNGLDIFGSTATCAFYDLPILENVCLDAIDSPLANFIYDHVEHPVVFMEDCSLNSAHFETAFVLAYPNPVQDRLMLHSQTVIRQIEVYDMLGNEVMNIPVNQQQCQLNVQSLANGLYLLRVHLEDGILKYLKIIKK